METYNPLRGEEYVLVDHITKKRFSNLQDNFWIQEGVLRDLPKWKDKIFACCLSTSKIGFAAVVPWAPFMQKLKERLEQEFPDLIESRSSLFFHFELSAENLDKVLKIRSELGDDLSGEWCIGGMLDNCGFADSKRPLWDLAFLLGESKKIGCVLHLGEMHQVFFMSRHFEGLEELIEIEPQG